MTDQVIRDYAAKVKAIKVARGRYEVRGAKGTWTIRKVDDLWFIDRPDGRDDRQNAVSLTEAKAFVACLDQQKEAA